MSKHRFFIDIHNLETEAMRADPEGEVDAILLEIRLELRSGDLESLDGLIRDSNNERVGGIYYDELTDGKWKSLLKKAKKTRQDHSGLGGE